MMNARFKDFDAMVAEAKQQPLVFKYGGVNFSLPPECPAMVVLELMRLDSSNPEADVDPETIINTLRSLLGEEQYGVLLETGISLSLLSDIVSWAIDVYKGDLPNTMTPPNPVEGE